MTRFAALLAGALAAGSMLATPVFADTDTAGAGGSYTQHQLDCLGLLFSNPAEHQQECGGPFTVTPPPSSSGGSGTPSCPRYVGQIAPIDLPGVPRIVTDTNELVAVTCCQADLTLKPWLGPDSILGYGAEERVLIAEPCGN